MKSKLILAFFAIVFFLTPSKINAAADSEQSFLSSIPILPVIILILILIVAGIVIVLEIKKSTQTPYNLPKGPSPTPQPEANLNNPPVSEPMTSTLPLESTNPPITKTMSPPVQAFNDINQSVVPPIENPSPSVPEPVVETPPVTPVPPVVETPPAPPPEPLPVQPPPTQPKLSSIRPLLIGTFVILLAAVSVGAYFLTQTSKPKILPINYDDAAGKCLSSGGVTGESCSNKNKCDIAGGCNSACCSSTSDCPNGQTCSVSNGYCQSGKSCQTSQQPEPTSAPQGQRCKDKNGNDGETCANLNWCDNNGGCNKACCAGDSDCPTGQKCNIDNGFCKVAGKSCNPQPDGGQHKACQFDASQGKNICANTPGAGTDQCTTNEQCSANLTPVPTPTFIITPGQGGAACVGKTGNVCQSNGNGDGSVTVLNCTGVRNRYTCQTNHTRYSAAPQCNAATKTDEFTAYTNSGFVDPGGTFSCSVGPGGTCDIGQADIAVNESGFSGCWDTTKNCTNCGVIPTPTVPTPTPTGPILTPSPTPTGPPVPQCKGIRILVNHNGGWVDMTPAEKANLLVGTKLRYALPVIVNGFNATKALFQTLINGPSNNVTETTTTMTLGTTSYYYLEVIAQTGDYTVNGWLFINNGWH